MGQRRILLIDDNDLRRGTRVGVLNHAGYEVGVRDKHEDATKIGDEGGYDLVLVSLSVSDKPTTVYVTELKERHPDLPILLLTDIGVFAPAGFETKTNPGLNVKDFLTEVAEMVTDRPRIRKIPFWRD